MGAAERSNGLGTHFAAPLHIRPLILPSNYIRLIKDARDADSRSQVQQRLKPEMVLGPMYLEYLGVTSRTSKRAWAAWSRQVNAGAALQVSGTRSQSSAVRTPQQMGAARNPGFAI